MKVIINFSDFDKVQLGSTNQKTLLALTKNGTSSYVVIPSCLTYSVLDTSIEVTCESKLDSVVSIFNIFQTTVINIKSAGQKISKQKILLKGLGFKSTFDDSTKTISFKLGYSHQNLLPVPEYIKNIKLKKNLILLESTDKVLLGDYIRNIYQLRKSDAYKGKGFSYQYDTKKLKVIKKK